MKHRRTIWYITQIVMLAILFFALFRDSQMALNVMRGMVWLQLITLALCFWQADIKASVRAKGHAVTQIECVLPDTLILMGLFAGGWWFTAIAWVISLGLEYGIFFEKQTPPPVEKSGWDGSVYRWPDDK